MPTFQTTVCKRNKSKQIFLKYCSLLHFIKQPLIYYIVTPKRCKMDHFNVDLAELR